MDMKHNDKTYSKTTNPDELIKQNIRRFFSKSWRAGNILYAVKGTGLKVLLFVMVIPLGFLANHVLFLSTPMHEFCHALAGIPYGRFEVIDWWGAAFTAPGIFGALSGPVGEILGLALIAWLFASRRRFLGAAFVLGMMPVSVYWAVDSSDFIKAKVASPWGWYLYCVIMIAFSLSMLARHLLIVAKAWDAKVKEQALTLSKKMV